MSDDDGWRWTLNWGAIRDDLVIGSCPVTVADIDRIRIETGVTALLSVQTDLCRGAFCIDYDAHCRHGQQAGLVLVNAPMHDFDPPDQRRRLPGAVRALHRLLAGGHSVYVHCTAGINRAPLTVLAYLTLVEGMTSKDAIALILRGRPQAEPYWEAYNGCRTDLVAANEASIQRRARDLAQRDPAGSADRHRGEAERQIIRDVLLA